MKLFSGVDLAADPAKTGVATIEERGTGSGGRGLRVAHAELGADDDAVGDLAASSTLTGIDVPLGWPRGFREVVEKHAEGALEAVGDSGAAWRRLLTNRFTDLEVRRNVGVVPLSVAADRIAHPALRWAAIEAGLRARGLNVDRAGYGRLAEVYPAAALKQWGMRYRGYKTLDPSTRRSIIAALTEEFSIDWAGNRGAAEESADVLDAVVAAIVAREIRAGRCLPPPAENEELAALIAEEGWIWVPSA